MSGPSASDEYVASVESVAAELAQWERRPNGDWYQRLDEDVYAGPCSVTEVAEAVYNRLSAAPK